MKCRILVAALATVSAVSAVAATPEQLLTSYEAEARSMVKGFAGFSSARGEKFFNSTHGAAWSCASCHGAAPTAAGKHAKTGKTITPLAPTANAERFTDPAKVEKWFKRNCNDVLARACTPLEKGDVMTFLAAFGR